LTGGWQGDGTKTYITTQGNNGKAQANVDGDSNSNNDYRPSAPGANFTYPFSLTDTNPTNYRDASVTQLWYTANMYHDLLYLLGFTEAAGNFETNNNGKGGKGADAVILNAQDGSGTNNANFATPPDGQPGVMRMFLWTESTIKRDCAFDAGVILHEYTHGLSNRLTGGPANSNCLNTLEAGGMGEGWGDFMAIANYIKTTDTRATNYPLGDWIFNNPAGIRSYLYSTSLTTNPLTYKSLNALNEVHAIGTMWANTLYEVMWNLVDEYGVNTAIRPTFTAAGVPTTGGFLAMKLVLDAMAL
jgi:extracellular elastinolytic metalloproteinase